MDFRVMAQALRAFNVMYRNKGILWGPTYADPDTRFFQGIDDEVQSGESGRYKLLVNNLNVERIGCGPISDRDVCYDGVGSQDTWKKTHLVAQYVHSVQEIIDEAGYDAPYIEIGPALEPFKDDIRMRTKPW
jgi:hypothetical protein